MRRPHPRIRKATKWSSTAIALMLLVAWGASEYRWFNLETTNWTTHLGRGGMVVVYHDSISFRSPPGWYSGKYDQMTIERTWWIQAWDTSGGSLPLPYNRVRFPLWIPMCIMLPLSGVAWRFDILARRRAQLPLCQNCSYNLTGLRPGSNCPECNTPPPKAEEISSS